MMHRSASSGSRKKVAYIMSRFPKLTETFVLYEILAVEEQGIQVEVYPLLREPAGLMHPESARLVEKAHFQPFLSWSIIKAQIYFLLRKPQTYFGALWTLLRSNWGSLNYFIGGLGIFPKSVYFARQMGMDGITHIHAHFSNHPAAAAFIVHKLTDIPFSFVAHGSDLHRDRHMLCEKVSEAKFVIAISEFNREIILAECGNQYSGKIVILHCGVDTQVFYRRDGQPKSNQGSKPFTIFCIGTLHEVKGQTKLIEACRQLSDHGLKFICHFIGDGPDREKLVNQVHQAGLDRQIIFHGQMTRDAVVELLQQADVVVAPSIPSSDGRREGIPVVLMEAMSCRIPVIASRLSGIPELITHEVSGLLVPPGDSVALAEAIERLYQDPILSRRMGSAGGDKVEHEFNLHKNVSALMQMF